MTPAFRLWRELSAEGVTLSVVGEDLHYDGPRRALTDGRKQSMKQHKAELVEMISALAASEREDMDAEAMAARKDGWLVLDEGSAYGMQLSQARMLFLLRDPDGTWRVWRGDWKQGSSEPYSQTTLGYAYTFPEALERGNDYVRWCRESVTNRSYGMGRNVVATSEDIHNET